MAISENIVEQVEEQVSNMENMENNVQSFSNPLVFNNISWEEFCDLEEESVKNFFKIVDTGDLEVVDGESILAESKSFRGQFKLKIVNSSIQIPILQGSKSFYVKTTTSKGKINERGVILRQYRKRAIKIDEENEQNISEGLFSFIPFNDKTSIHGFFQSIVRQGVSIPFPCFFNVIKKQSEEPLTDLVIPPDYIVDVTTRLNDNQIILISNSSSKLKNEVENWSTISDLSHFVKEQIFNTIDPSYVFKLMDLNKNVIFDIGE